mmetsp:Transcript_23640/g.61782  ORF Transcript_23640/g.61782 Transcript_23640/m.61782 type:complete len:245 (-) Transcript_23640:1712-2446(-)
MQHHRVLRQDGLAALSELALQAEVLEDLHQGAPEPGDPHPGRDHRDEPHRVDVGPGAVEQPKDEVGAGERPLDQLGPQLVIVDLFAKVDRLADVAELGDDQLKGLLDVAHPLQQEHHLRDHAVLLTDLHGVLQGDVVALLQQGHEPLGVVLGRQPHLECPKVAAGVGVNERQLLEVHVLVPFLRLELCNHVDHRHALRVVHQELGRLLSVELHQQHNLVLDRVEEVVLRNQVEDVTALQLEVNM